MNDIKASHCINVRHIAGAQDDYRISVDFDGNIILLTEQKVQGRYLHKVFHVVNGK
ncbi:hypothetical protein ACIFOT_19485 [Neobacillus sp. NRS-1170]|uniref:hypothetical protein n=1 Tax=Neobacillus sp. NRS-1170 TaxID=3233898 RepID=UPI003D27218B